MVCFSYLNNVKFTSVAFLRKNIKHTFKGEREVCFEMMRWNKNIENVTQKKCSKACFFKKPSLLEINFSSVKFIYVQEKEQ